MSSNADPKVPFVDLIALHQEIKSELVEVFEASIGSASFVGGPMVENFEREYAAYCETTHCVGVGSGTDALRFALAAAGVQRGDIVITVPLTFIATTEAISQVGALPAFVDIDSQSYTMDPKSLISYLESQCSVDPRTGKCMHRVSQRPVTAVVPVHLYGHTVEMDPIVEVAERFHLIVIEDACQAHGAEYFSKRNNRWQKAGSMGHAAAFSFYPGKNLGACGEGGAVTTDDPEIAKKVSMLRDHGQSRKYYHDLEGYNGRLDSIQAGILQVKLKSLDEANRKRHRAAQRYNELLSSVPGVVSPVRFEWSRPVYHLYVIRIDGRDTLQRQLTAAGIGTGIHYPVPLHRQKAYEFLGYTQGEFPVAETVASEILSLPMYPQLTAEQQELVTASVKSSLGARQANQEVQVSSLT